MGASHLRKWHLPAGHSFYRWVSVRAFWRAWSARSAQRVDVIERGSQPGLFDLQVQVSLQGGVLVVEDEQGRAAGVLP